MPIAPEYRWLYPIDWPELSNLIRFRRAKGRCEHCRRPHGRDVLHLGDGTWWDEGAAIWRDGRGRGLRYVPAPDAVPVREPGLDHSDRSGCAELSGTCFDLSDNSLCVLSDICARLSDMLTTDLRTLIVQRIAKAKPRAIWTPVDFLDLGTRDAIDKL